MALLSTLPVSDQADSIYSPAPDYSFALSLLKILEFDAF